VGLARGQEPDDGAAYMRALNEVSKSLITVDLLKEWCTARAPQAATGLASAIEAWHRKQGVTEAAAFLAKAQSASAKVQESRAKARESLSSTPK
jgi:hypothetical protein